MIDARQRYSRSRPCPICRGSASDPRHQQRRCIGFLSSDGRYARCSREEHAGALPLDEKTGAYLHHLEGRCRCGIEHGATVERAPARMVWRPVLPPIETAPAPALPPVAAWLRGVRRLANAEVEHMRAAETKAGPAVAFRYLRPDGRVLAVKVRPIDQKDRMFRSPAGAGALPLYGHGILARELNQVVVTEGELDMHALRSAGIHNVVSVPDGYQTRLTPALLAPLARVSRVVVAVDADQKGEGLAQRLAAALGPERCRRVVFGQHKDANAALVAGWTGREFQDALRGQRATAA